VLVAIGYRLFKAEGSAVAMIDATAVLPKGARIVSTGVAGDRLVLTLDIGGGDRNPHLRRQELKTRRTAELRREP